MSVSFQGVKPKGSKFPETLNLNNGLVHRILRAMDYPVTIETSGEMPIEKAVAGIAKARATIEGEDVDYLDMLDDLVKELVKARRKKLVWY